ncbi:MAG: hypothetical protein KDC46_07760 [Thermoleophilia bacterium]|nr:hypothetical protein [Thermoleophilia bacterium]
MGSTRPAEAAQSTIEFIGSLPVLLLAATCCVQALLLALGVVFAQSAVGRAAQGQDRADVVASVPPGWRAHTRVHRQGRRVVVTVQAPALLPGTGRWLQVSARSEAAT